VVARATVLNQGDLDSAPYRVQALVDGVEVGFVDRPALAFGDDEVVEIELGTLAEGARTVTMVLDPADAIPELIETNNSGERSVTVLAQAPLSVGTPVTGLSAQPNEEILFVLTIPPGAQDALTISVTDPSPGPEDDLDLFVQEGTRPGFREDYVDCVSAGPTTEESCQIVFPEGTYNILLHAWDDPSVPRTGFDDVTLTATLGDQILPFDIEVVIVDNGTPSQDQTFLDAAATWEQIIVGDIPQQDFSTDPIDASACGAAGIVDDVVDDVRIYVRIDSIDGLNGTLAQAGPCFPRQISGFPILGTMIFDEDDVAKLEAAGDLEPVVLHEMGHVLGIGTMWKSRGLVQDPSLDGDVEIPGLQDTHFTGDGAIEAFDAAGGVAYMDSKVPVENEAGPGSSDSHWRESVLDLELMTPFLEAGQSKPLSAITIRSLGDLGYGVDVSAADPYSLPLPFPALSAGAAVDSTTRIDLRGDIREGPVTVLDSKGRVVEVRW
jgi:hypothetical protein